MKKEKKETCKTCKHWKNQQSELEYTKFFGICVCPELKFTTKDNPTVRVLDRRNRAEGKWMGVQVFENTSEVVPIGQVERSQYCMVTSEHFGCINYKK